METPSPHLSHATSRMGTEPPASVLDFKRTTDDEGQIVDVVLDANGGAQEADLMRAVAAWDEVNETETSVSCGISLVTDAEVAPIGSLCMTLWATTVELQDGNDDVQADLLTDDQDQVPVINIVYSRTDKHGDMAALRAIAKTGRVSVSLADAPDLGSLICPVDVEAIEILMAAGANLARL